MNKLFISDALNELYPELELDSKTRVSKRKIKNMVMGQIDAKAKKCRKLKLAVIMTSVIILVSSIIAIASTTSEGFRMFLSDNLLSFRSREINKSVTDSGIRMTVKSAINDGTSGMILIEFVKEDQQAFLEDIDLSDLKLYTSKGGVQYQRQVEFSDDRKTMYCLLRVLSVAQITNQKLTVALNDIKSNIILEQKQIDIDLLSLCDNGTIYESDDILQMNIQNFDRNIYEGLYFEGITFVKNDLCVVFDINSNSAQTVSIPCLVIKSSGEKLFADEYYNFISPISEERERVCMIFKNKNLDLSDLNILVDSLQGTNIEGEWSIHFKMSSGDQPIEKSADINLKIGDCTLEVSKVRASMLGLYITGILRDKDGQILNEFFSLDTSIVLKNGDIINPLGNSLEYISDNFLMSSILKEPIHLSDIQKVVINGVEVSF